MEEKKTQPIKIEYIPVMPNCPEDDEIDLKELFQTIWKYKKFIIIFTFCITLFAGIYAFFKTPIYEIKAILSPGYINTIITDSGIQKAYIKDPQEWSIYINSNFNRSKSNPLPKIEAKTLKQNNHLIKVTIEDLSNQKAIKDLTSILNTIKKIENQEITAYKNSIQKQIDILRIQKKEILKNIESLKKKLKTVQNPKMYEIVLTNLQRLTDKKFSVDQKIASLNNKLSPVFIKTTKILGKIEQYDYPIKPKRKLIIIVAFITSLILSIFLVFFIEFIKGIKEEQ